MSEAQVFWDLYFSQGSALSLGGSRKGGTEADTPLHRRQHVSWEPTPSQKEKKWPCFAVLFSDLCWGCLETWNAIYHCICDSQGEWGDIVNELSFNSVSCFVKENTNSHLCPTCYPEEKLHKTPQSDHEDTRKWYTAQYLWRYSETVYLAADGEWMLTPHYEAEQAACSWQLRSYQKRPCMSNLHCHSTLDL